MGISVAMQQRCFVCLMQRGTRRGKGSRPAIAGSGRLQAATPLQHGASQTFCKHTRLCCMLGDPGMQLKVTWSMTKFMARTVSSMGV